MSGWRSALFTPANSERMIRKAATLDQDVEILDLEDAVPEGEKEAARALLSSLLGELDWRGKRVCVRVNGLAGPEALRDLELVSRLDAVSCVVVPKAFRGAARVVYRVTGRDVVPLVETAEGYAGLEDIAREEGVVALAWGNADLALSVGGSPEAYEDSGVREAVVLVAKAYGLAALDRVYFKVDDLEGLRRDSLRARALGFNGKMVIHPSHVPVVNEVFSPTREEVEWALKVVKAYEEAARASRGAIRLEGQLVDAVHYRLAKAILEAAQGRSINPSS